MSRNEFNPDAPDPTDLDVDLLRFLEEEMRRGEGEEGEQRLRKSLYEPSRELVLLAGSFIGAAIEVHHHLGPGYTESVYQRALCHELERRSIPYAVEVPIDIVYKDRLIGSYRLDLVIDQRLLIELKQ